MTGIDGEVPTRDDDARMAAIIVASADPNRATTCAAAIAATCPGGTLITVVAYGDRRAEVADAVMAIVTGRAAELDAREVRLRVDIVEPIAGIIASTKERALSGAIAWSLGLPPLVFFVDDDAVPSCEDAWVALATTIAGKAVAIDDGIARWPASALPIAAACSVSEATASRSTRLRFEPHELGAGADQYAVTRAAAFVGIVTPCEVLDGPIVAVTREALRAAGPFVSVRALGPALARAGFACAIAEAAYVPRTAPPALPEHEPPGIVGRLQVQAAFDDATVSASHRLSVAIVARFERLQDLHALRMCVFRASMVTDGIAIVLAQNPLEMQRDPEFRLAATGKAGSTIAPLGRSDQVLLQACAGAEVSSVERAVVEWIAAIAREGNAPAHFSVSVRAAVGQGAAARTRAQAWQLARDLPGTTWILALDQDEAIEDGVDRVAMARLMAHPDPGVVAYDIGIVTHWDTGRLVRDDAPFGDGGSLTGVSEVRMVRALPGRAPPDAIGTEHVRYAPLVGSDGVRVAALRLRRSRYLRPTDRARLVPPSANVAEDGMRLSAWAPRRLGMHVLVYERENPEDVARWLDDVHGLVDDVVLVWTGAWELADTDWLDGAGRPQFMRYGEGRATGPDFTLVAVAVAYGARFVRHALADDIAAARNAGIRALASGSALRDRPALAWFVDPDEWLTDPIADGRTTRRMAECASRTGWLWKVANHRHDGGPPTLSDSVRLSRLDGDPLLMSGRVHESFDDANLALKEAGIHPRITYAPYTVQHRGMKDAVASDAKLDWYERLLRMRLDEKPADPGAWVGLSWHYENDGHPAEAAECMRRALACAGTSYLPYKEELFRRMRDARDAGRACRDRLIEAHPFWSTNAQILDLLEKLTPDVRRIPRATQRDPLPLPAFPE